MSRPQFTLKTLLWLMVVVGAFLGGMALQKRLGMPVITSPAKVRPGQVYTQTIELNGEEWHRLVKATPNE